MTEILSVARPGNTTGGGPYQFLFNSQTPTFMTWMEDTITLSGSSQPPSNNTNVTINHGLGYPPWVLAYQILPGYPSITAFEPSAAVLNYWHFSAQGISVDSQNMYINVNIFDDPGGSLGFTNDPTTIHYIISTYPITRNFTSTITTSIEVTGGADYTTGIKATLPGKSFTSSDLRDFSMHPQGKQLNIYASGSGHGSLGTNFSPYIDDSLITTANDYCFSINHNLGYAPMCLQAFTALNNPNLWLVNNYYYSTNNVVFTTDSSNRSFSLLLFSEPVTPTDVSLQVINYA